MTIRTSTYKGKDGHKCSGARSFNVAIADVNDGTNRAVQFQEMDEENSCDNFQFWRPADEVCEEVEDKADYSWQWVRFRESCDTCESVGISLDVTSAEQGLQMVWLCQERLDDDRIRRIL